MTAGFVSQANAGSGTNTMTITKPSSVVVGSILVALIQQQGGDLGSIVAPAGWQLRAGNVANSQGQGAIFTRTADATDVAATNYTFTWGANPIPIIVEGMILNYGSPASVLGNGAMVGQTPAATVMTYPSVSVAASCLQIVALISPQSGTTTEFSGMTRRTNPTTGFAVYDASVAAGSTPVRTDADGPQGGGSNNPATLNWMGLFLAVPSAPAAPTLISPVGGAPVDATAVIPLVAKYNSTDGADANAYTLSIKVDSGTVHYWNASAGTLTATSPVWNTLSTTVPDQQQLTVNLPANVLANAHTITWAMAFQESSANLQGPASTAATFVTQPAPTVVVNTPSGTVTSSNTPTISWTDTLHSGSSQIGYHVTVESGSFGTVPGSGTTVFDEVGTSATSTVPDPLPNATSYRVFVQITQTGGQPSAWAHSDFTISVTPPNTPSLATTVTADPTTGLQIVNLTVTGNDSGPNFDHTNTVFDVEASYDGGATWVGVRYGSALAPDSHDQASIQDFESPSGATAQYRARTVGTPGANPIIGAYCAPVTATVARDLMWLMDPQDPTSALQVPIVTDGQRSEPITQDIIPTLGSSEPVIEEDDRQLQQGSTAFVTFTAADLTALRNLLMRGRTLLMLFPQEQDQPGEALYFQPVGALPRSRTADDAAIPGRVQQVDWAERSSP